jgi:hypothetical protein
MYKVSGLMSKVPIAIGIEAGLPYYWNLVPIAIGIGI